MEKHEHQRVGKAKLSKILREVSDEVMARLARGEDPQLIADWRGSEIRRRLESEISNA